jgi:hypothetical protein
VVIKGWDKLVNGDIIKITLWNDNAIDNTSWSTDDQGYTSYPYSFNQLFMILYVKILANYDAYYHQTLGSNAVAKLDANTMYYGISIDPVPSFSNDHPPIVYDNKISSLSITTTPNSVIFDYTIQTTITVDLGSTTLFCNHRRGNCRCYGCRDDFGSYVDSFGNAYCCTTGPCSALPAYVNSN